MISMPVKHRARSIAAPKNGPSVAVTKITGKFPECAQCLFYCSRRRNPICNDCDVGEYFEERVEGLRPSRDNKFRGRDYDDE